MSNRLSKKLAKELLLSAAEDVARQLDEPTEFPRLWLWEELEAFSTGSGGWTVQLGALGSSSPRLELWIDKYTRVGEYRLYAGYAAGLPKQLQPLIDAAPTRWRDALEIGPDDVEWGGKVTRLREPLDEDRFGRPIVERLWRGDNYFGVYDPISPTDRLAKSRFCALAVPFFRDTLAAVEEPEASVDAVSDEDYPGVIERRRVYRHVRFERSSKYARERKRRDGYECKICDLKMADLYGKYGKDFAEAHHKVPLHRLEKESRVLLRDLLTVCPNCHRMLHKMMGERDDWKELQGIVRSRRHR